MSADRQERSWGPALAVLLAALLYLPGLGGHDLWSPDEPRYGEVAREMLLTGDYVSLRVNGESYSQKPPLMFWLMAAAAHARGELDETAVRLPSAIAAIASVLFVFLLARRLFDERAAWLSSAIFATSAKVLWQARRGQIDMLLTALVLAAMYAWVTAWLDGHPRRAYLFWGLSGLATLAKGPVGLLPSLLTVLVFLALRRDRRSLAALHIPTGLLLWVGVVAIWLVPALLAGGPEYTHDLLFSQNLERYFNPWHHYAPWYYFVVMVLPIDFAPWSIFLPGALVAGALRFEGERRRHLLFVCTWAAVNLVFFSLTPAKRNVYLLPSYGAFAMIVAVGVMAALGAAGTRWRRWVTVPGWAAAAVLVAATVAPLVLDVPEPWAEVAAGLPLRVAVGAGILAAGAVGAALLAQRGSASAFVAAFAVAIAIGSSLLLYWALPVVNRVKSARPLAEYVATLPPRADLAMYPNLDARFLFYGRRFVEVLPGPSELGDFLGRRPGVKWVLAEEDHATALAATGCFREEAAEALRPGGYSLFRTRTDGRSARPPTDGGTALPVPLAHCLPAADQAAAPEQAPDRDPPGARTEGRGESG